MVYLTYPLLVHPIRLREELERAQIAHLGVSYKRSQAVTMIGFREVTPEVTKQVDRVVQLVLQLTKDKTPWETVKEGRSTFVPVPKTPELIP